MEIVFSLSMALFLYLRRYYQNFIPSSYLKILNFIFGSLFLDKDISMPDFSKISENFGKKNEENDNENKEIDTSENKCDKNIEKLKEEILEN